MPPLETLEAQVLKLARADRSRLLERLIASLDDDPAVEAAWEALAEARDAEIDTGAAQPTSLDAAIARLEARFPG